MAEQDRGRRPRAAVRLQNSSLIRRRYGLARKVSGGTPGSIRDVVASQHQLNSAQRTGAQMRCAAVQFGLLSHQANRVRSRTATLPSRGTAQDHVPARGPAVVVDGDPTPSAELTRR